MIALLPEPDSRMDTMLQRLAAVEPGGSAGLATEAYARNRANHTGVQSADSLVDGVNVKAYSAAERVKLTTLSVAEVWASDPSYGTPGTRAAFINCLNAAQALGRGTIVRIPAGLTINVEQGLSLAGYSVQIRGAGAGINAGTPNISVIRASSQSGPVLDFRNYLYPADFRGKVTPLADVYIQGSGVADPTKANSGVRIDHIGSATFRDISISHTGGPCLDLTAVTPGVAVYLCDFERITLYTPVNCRDNDVPYMRAVEHNGNRFRGIGLRSTTSTNDCPPSGAVVCSAANIYTTGNNLYDGFWYEYLHVPTNGTLFHLAGNMNIVRDFQFFDCFKEAGATGTSYYRLGLPGVLDHGGNHISGVIHGNNGGSGTYIDTGVDIRQSRNTVTGTKGFNGANVTLAAGVDRCYVHLRGSVSGSNQPGWINNSGMANNHLIDEYLQTEVRPAGWTTPGVPARVSGITGAPAAARLMGGTASGPPVSGTFQANDYVISTDGNLYICTVGGAPGTWVTVGTPPALTSLSADALTVGEIVPRRDRINSNSVALLSGLLVLGYWTADKTETINTLTAHTGGAAAGATPTLCRMGVYSVAGNGNLTLVAATDDDTSLFAAANTAYPKALASPWNKVAGQRYAVGLLVVTGAAMPTFHGQLWPSTAVSSALLFAGPPVVSRMLSQTDLPSSIAAGSLAGYQGMPAIRMS
ncbi:hypothetical protein [Verrucosispora sp. WMMC514]|uniref:hypothetical protein n=1 Tax=Verrucosispora sp. WMMC514 TaxID=3015156 RepID=UPI00248C720E|nr:hypothetical protein [Verrucosispora sp. WMMC514]WBB94190.1 hypothetical protein O7597_15175 [Verrucosispora sp. WMMC514]